MVGNLDPQFSAEVRDILSEPPATRKYETLKSALIARLSASSERRLKQVLNQEEMGDRSPGQFFRHLQGLAGATVPENLLRTIWRSRLPPAVQATLATQSDTVPLDAITTMADTVHEIISNNRVASVSTPDFSRQLETRLDRQDKVLADLQQRIESLCRASSQDRRSRSQHRSRDSSHRDRSSSRSSQPDDVCWYHHRFGKDAKSCREPCKFALNSNPSSRSENSQREQPK